MNCTFCAIPFESSSTFFPPPVHYAEAFEPGFQFCNGLGTFEPFETREKERLIAHSHLFVQTAFFGQIAYVRHVVGTQPVVAEPNLSAVGSCNVVDDADKGCLSCSVRTEQAVDFPFRDTDAHIVKSLVIGELFADVFSSDNVHILNGLIVVAAGISSMACGRAVCNVQVNNL